MKVVYIVEIGWRSMFKFDDIQEASAFADQAKKHRFDDSDDKIVIKLIDEESGADDKISG